MQWQDIAISIAQWAAVAALVPSIFSKDKPALSLVLAHLRVRRHVHGKLPDSRAHCLRHFRRFASSCVGHPRVPTVANRPREEG